MGGLIVLMLWLLLRQKRKSQKGTSDTRKDKRLASSLKELDKELEEFDKKLEQKEPSTQEEEKTWTEKRKYARVERDFPVSLILDKVKPISAAVKNISLGGAYAICNDVKLFKLGDRCQFKCDLVDMGLDFGINGKAEIVRIRSTRGLGLKFSELDEDSINYLLKF